MAKMSMIKLEKTQFPNTVFNIIFTIDKYRNLSEIPILLYLEIRNIGMSLGEPCLFEESGDFYPAV